MSDFIYIYIYDVHRDKRYIVLQKENLCIQREKSQRDRVCKTTLPIIVPKMYAICTAITHIFYTVVKGLCVL